MSTTSLFIEILIVGSIADIWLGLFLLTFFPIDLANLSFVVNTLVKFSTFLAIPFLAITYILGGLILFVSEQILNPFFQTRFKHKFFSNAKLRYGDVRATFYQKASEQVIEDLKFDRQIIRISRTSVLNFLLLTIGLIPHLKVYPDVAMYGIITSLLFMVFSFWQWKERYELSYKKMLDTYHVLREKNRK